jgi:levanase/fructan beta-fructosidase
VRVQVLLDKSSLEVFFNNGEKVFSTYIFPQKGADALSIFSDGGKITIHSLKIWDLSAVKN